MAYNRNINLLGGFAMNQRKLANLLKTVIIGAGSCAAAVYLFILPQVGLNIVEKYPEFDYAFWPWLIFLFGTALPVFAALGCAFRVAVEIGRDNSFSKINAKMLKAIAILAAADTSYFFVGNAVLFALSMNFVAIVLLSLLVVFIGFAVTVACGALSHLILKAAEMREENELTI